MSENASVNLSTPPAATDHLAGDIPESGTPTAPVTAVAATNGDAVEQISDTAAIDAAIATAEGTEDDVSTESTESTESEESEESDGQLDPLVAEGDAAGDYLERLLDILDYDGDIDLDVEGERAVVSIVGDGDVDNLVGDRGQVLDALQELTRLAATAETGQRSRLMLDIAGYRARRRAELTELGSKTAQGVLSDGEPARLSPMNPFERKVVHDAVAAVDGVTSHSEGEEPHRRVVVTVAD